MWQHYIFPLGAGEQHKKLPFRTYITVGVGSVCGVVVVTRGLCLSVAPRCLLSESRLSLSVVSMYQLSPRRVAVV